MTPAQAGNQYFDSAGFPSARDGGIASRGLSPISAELTWLTQRQGF
jgi:hypothetical protein